MPLRPPMREAPLALAPLADRVHALIEQLVRTVDDESAFEEDVRWAVAQLDAVRARLAPHARRVELGLGRPGDPPDGRPYYLTGVLIGRHHAMTMPVEMTTTRGVSTGSVNLDVAWEGPPGCVHGGFLAHLFDCILGQHNLNVGVPAMTGSLEVRYRSPTPLHTDLTFEIRSDPPEGRKIKTRAELRTASMLCAEAEGTFIVPGRPPGGAGVWSDAEG